MPYDLEVVGKRSDDWTLRLIFSTPKNTIEHPPPQYGTLQTSLINILPLPLKGKKTKRETNGQNI
jgi:hypothetical protein